MTTMTKPKERPIIMSGESVRAILAGRKSQTRRVVAFKSWADLPVVNMLEHRQPYTDSPANWQEWTADHADQPFEKRAYTYVEQGILCPFGMVGDRLWVRETFIDMGGGEPGALHYRVEANDADLKWIESEGFHWRSPIHMPRWASRITLEIVSVRVERLQEIKIDPDIIKAEGLVHAWSSRNGDSFREWNDAAKSRSEAEGIFFYHALFANYWDRLNAKRGYGWNKNPFCWVIEFSRVDDEAQEMHQ